MNQSATAAVFGVFSHDALGPEVHINHVLSDSASFGVSESSYLFLWVFFPLHVERRNTRGKTGLE